MLSTAHRGISLVLFLGLILSNLGQYCQATTEKNHDAQLLDCSSTEPISIGQQSLPCKTAQNPRGVGVANSSQVSSPSAEPTNVISIDFNNVLKRQVQSDSSDDNCTSSQNVAEHVLCKPSNMSAALKEATRQGSIDVYIIPSDRDVADSAGSTIHRVAPGSTSIIKCRFNVSNASDSIDLSLKLRWLRSVASSQGQLKNQSIVSDENYQVTISTNKIWTLQRKGGLDLVLNDFELSDAGDYFCQALSEADSSVLDEKRIHVIPREINRVASKDPPNFADSDSSSLYSPDNLEKLMPSLRIYPEYSELAFGESIQLACVTSELDPDPEPNQVEWHFEPFKRPGYASASDKTDQQEGVSSFGLPSNTSRVGNILMVWFMSHETIGVYKCSVHLADFNLTAEASAELAMRPSVDSAPLVYITPELLRLSANGSAKIQCESTGYPAPILEWYRVETVLNVTPSSDEIAPQSASTHNQSRIEHISGMQVVQLEPRDSMAYCLQHGCRSLDNLDPLSRHQIPREDKIRSHRVLVTGVSWLQVTGARANHQGQYVCKASNKHGSNQASSIIDVEFKETPVVEIDEGNRHQTIILDSGAENSASTALVPMPQNVSFRCSIKSGQPKPKLKWLRTSGGGDAYARGFYKSANILDGHDPSGGNVSSRTSQDNLDLYDLTHMSSATSKVVTVYENDRRTLILQLSTISIDDEGDYICLGENELGRHSAVAQLVVRKPPHVRILQSSPKIFRPNESFQLDCLVTGHPSPVDIEWSRSDRGAYFSLISRHSPSLSAHQERAVLKFDRTTPDEAGEYTCAARDPLSEFNILRDTIMLLAEDDQLGSRATSLDDTSGKSLARHVPKLLVRPTKVTAEVGSNITLDCLAVSGLQPTVVEWIAPASALMSQPTSPDNHVRPYYRSPLIELTHGTQSSPDALLQFGSKLRLFNVSRAHEGVYQCKGRNKAGIENAPALVTIIERVTPRDQLLDTRTQDDNSLQVGSEANLTETKTKIARMGSNIELRCQVNGVDEQPATSWSREGRQLPQSSVQIDHNLWIQNLTKADEGLYLCSVRSREPNEIIQAMIKLLVHETGRDDHKIGGVAKYNPADLNAKIVASKYNLNVGDSVTLECMITIVGNTTQYPSRALDHLERQVVWTNLHSGQSLFQDNVYIQNNLLIIYDLKLENTATYRCNYNELTQYTDYKLHISVPDEHGSEVSNSSSSVSDRDQFGSIITYHHSTEPTTMHLNGTRRVEHIRTSVGARLIVDCPKLSNDTTDRYFWTRGHGPLQSANSSSPLRRRRVGREMEQLVLNPVETSQAGLYQCFRQLTNSNGTLYRVEMHFLVEIRVVSAKFAQRPVSFVTLPAVSDADHQLELEIKFYPEQEHGLILFSGSLHANTLSTGSLNAHTGGSQQQGSNLSTLTSADYISLGLVKGHLEFRFELGDGVTLLRSSQPLKLSQWHRVLIERNRRGATMWLDGQAPQSNSSRGKFFNLNLDSLLYVGGHQIFLTLASTSQQRYPTNSTDSHQPRAFYGFSRGLQGCISYLRINGRELNLMSRNRSVAMGIFECDKPECPAKQSDASADYKPVDCSEQNGVCQVDRTLTNSTPQDSRTNPTIKKLRSHQNADLRCICLPGYDGPGCRETMPLYELENVTQEVNNSQGHHQVHNPTATTRAPTPAESHSACDQYPEAKCNSSGTGQCQSLSSTIFKCHCKPGFMGELCDEMIAYTSETSIGFNHPAFIQLALNSPQDVTKSLAAGPQGISSLGPAISGSFNETEYLRLVSFTEKQNISFRVQTRSSYGLLFYIGQVSTFPTNEDGSYKVVELSHGKHVQASKSIIVNLLARLSTRRVGDFLAVALVDGHVELSYELGSGLAIVRSTRRFNDGEWHKIEVSRMGKSSRLTIDDVHEHKAQSPGKLSMLNVDPDIYLGGLPTRLQAAISASSSSGSLLSTFMGCLSSLQINSLGPINLIRDDHLTQVRSASNLVPCNNGLLSQQQPTSVGQQLQQQQGDKISIDQVATNSTTPASLLTPKKSTRKPTKPAHNAESDDDDADELARRSS